MPTPEQCRKLIFNLGIKLGVSPKLISTRLLSDDDKNDMLSGLVDNDELEVHVVAWMGNKMPDYANGSTISYTSSKDLPMQRYRGLGSK